MDSEGRDPLELLDEVEQELGMPCVADDMAGGPGQAVWQDVVNLRTKSMRLFDAGADKRGEDDEVVSLDQRDKLAARSATNGIWPSRTWS
ncbi:MAG: hypothetical protein QM805_22390 [Pseudomonas sp.]